MAKTNKTMRTKNGSRLIVWLMFSRYKPKIDGSKISNLSIDRVYLIYVHYRKFQGKSTYPDEINPFLQDTQVFHAYVLTIVILHSYVGLLGFSKMWMRKEKWKMEKWGNQFWRENEKSFVKCKWKVISPILVEQRKLLSLY